MKIAGIILALILGVSGQTWVNRANLINFTDYFRETTQQLIYELEEMEWCNFQLQDSTVALNEHMYRWHVTGNVTFANGFLNSIQRIDLSNIGDVFGSRTVNGTIEATGTVRGRVNFRDALVGFDVIFEPNDGSKERYTGTFTYRNIGFQISVTKNLNTGELSTDVVQIDLSPGSVRMEFLPANNVTEVISRRAFVPRSISVSVNGWARDIIQPIVQRLVTTNMVFPSICFVNCR